MQNDSNSKFLQAQRQRALTRPELLQPTTPRQHNKTSGPTSMAAKLRDPAMVEMINNAVKRAPKEEKPMHPGPPHAPPPPVSETPKPRTLLAAHAKLVSDRERDLFAACCLALGAGSMCVADMMCTFMGVDLETVWPK